MRTLDGLTVPIRAVSGSKIEQLCFGENDIVLNLSDNCCIVSNSFGSVSTRTGQSYEGLQIDLCRMIGKTIEKVDDSNDLETIITMSGGDKIYLRMLDEMMENFSIYLQGDLYVS